MSVALAGSGGTLLSVAAVVPFELWDGTVGNRFRGSGGMVDAHALGACGANRAGSNPASPTNSAWQWRRAVGRDDVDAV